MDVAQLGIGLGRPAEGAILTWRAHAIVQQLVEQVAVHGIGEGQAHVAVLEERPHLGVFGGVVDVQAHVSAGDAQKDLKVALGLGLLVERKVAKAHSARLQVDLAVHHQHGQRFLPADAAVDDAIEIG